MGTLGIAVILFVITIAVLLILLAITSATAKLHQERADRAEGHLAAIDRMQPAIYDDKECLLAEAGMLLQRILMECCWPADGPGAELADKTYTLKRALSVLRAEEAEERALLAQDIGYPAQWDVAAYPALEDALRAIRDDFMLRLVKPVEEESAAVVPFVAPLWPQPEHPTEVPFARCDGNEQPTFERWAAAERFNMEEHPLHYLFLNPETNAARKGWCAAIEHCTDALVEDRERRLRAAVEASIAPAELVGPLTLHGQEWHGAVALTPRGPLVTMAFRVTPVARDLSVPQAVGA